MANFYREMLDRLDAGNAEAGGKTGRQARLDRIFADLENNATAALLKELQQSDLRELAEVRDAIRAALERLLSALQETTDRLAPEPQTVTVPGPFKTKSIEVVERKNGYASKLLWKGVDGRMVNALVTQRDINGHMVGIEFREGDSLIGQKTVSLKNNAHIRS